MALFDVDMGGLRTASSALASSRAGAGVMVRPRGEDRVKTDTAQKYDLLRGIGYINISEKPLDTAGDV
jgi:hypothetical protein